MNQLRMAVCTGLSSSSLSSCVRPSSLTPFPSAVPVWLEYAKFAVEKMSLMLDGMEFPRDVFERGIVASGLHVSQVHT